MSDIIEFYEEITIYVYKEIRDFFKPKLWYPTLDFKESPRNSAGSDGSNTWIKWLNFY